jgi:hypothetical protein
MRPPGLIRRFLGRAAFALGILAWGALLVGLFVGADSSRPADVQFLRSATSWGLALAVADLPLAAVALVVGPYRLAAFFGGGFAVAFFVYFAGMLAVFWTS